MSPEVRKKIVYVAYLFAVALFFVWGGLGAYWNGRLPTTPDEATGRVYVMHFHGTDGYANFNQIVLSYAPICSVNFGNTY